MNQSEDFSSSPYPCNALANARTRHVIAELNHAKPEFVVHLGDMINPVPELPTYEDAANNFKSLVEELEAPLYLVPGNHDVGDKPVSWMPAGRVSDEYLALYKSHFGSDYYSFDFKDFHFVIINAQLFNSGLSEEKTQKEWLVADFEKNTHKRTFIGIHYPPYVSNIDENGSYDNIDEPGRSWLISLLEKYSPEAMFCGHVHNFWYDLVHKTEMYLLPSTAFVRHDYSEFYKIEPGDQQGRNDEPKLGYFLVRVYETGHVIENIRTYGKELHPGQTLSEPSLSQKKSQSKESSVVHVGLDMRQPWAEELEIAPSGGVDEFERKLARNDYPILALWEMGIRRMRIPIQDILNTKIRRRMQILHQAGHIFQVYSYGLPRQNAIDCLAENARLVSELEIVINWENISETLPEIVALKVKTCSKIILSRVNRKATGKHQGGKFNHMISHGFTLAEANELNDFFSDNPQTKAIDGIVFTIPRDQEKLAAVIEAEKIGKLLNKEVCLYIKSTSSSPADVFFDDQANAELMLEAVFSSAGANNINIILDTFADTDRGYFSRSGLVDRRYNPKLGSRVLSTVIGILQGEFWSLDELDVNLGKGITLIRLNSTHGEQLTLINNKTEHGEANIDLTKITEGCTSEVISLESGNVESYHKGKCSISFPFIVRSRIKNWTA